MKKILAALDGSKTVLGLLLVALPEIVNHLVAFLTSLSPIFAALHWDGAVAGVATFTGAVLAFAGGIHKLLKIVQPLLKGE